MQWMSRMGHDDRATPFFAHPPRPAAGNALAVVLTGGGARASYQVGLLRGIARNFPDLQFQIIARVSAGAINATYLAAHHGSLSQKVGQLTDMWCALECEHIFRFDPWKLIPFRSALASIFPHRKWTRPRGVVDTAPLRALLERVLDTPSGQSIRGIAHNLKADDLHAVALITLDYSTGQSVRWVQGHNADVFEGPNRRAAETDLTVDHVLASAALPFLFPAVRIGSEWHGDGGIRLAAPLSPAVHLGASRILAMSTGYQRTPDEASTPLVTGYPPAAQILSQMVNAVFLDVIDEDVVRMERMNALVSKLDPQDRGGFRPIDLLVLRPSIDIGKLSAEYEHLLPRGLKLLSRSLGARETDSPDFLSMLMFVPEYTRRLIAIGEADVEARLPDLRQFFGDEQGPGAELQTRSALAG
jgi:NTE family protein